MRHRIPRETKAEMVAMSRQGMSHTAIATATGWSRGAVERVIRDWVDE
jgi:transposase-like protein